MTITILVCGPIGYFGERLGKFVFYLRLVLAVTKGTSGNKEEEEKGFLCHDGWVIYSGCSSVHEMYQKIFESLFVYLL